MPCTIMNVVPPNVTLPIVLTKFDFDRVDLNQCRPKNVQTAMVLGDDPSNDDI